MVGGDARQPMAGKGIRQYRQRSSAVLGAVHDVVEVADDETVAADADQAGWRCRSAPASGCWDDRHSRYRRTRSGPP